VKSLKYMIKDWFGLLLITMFLVTPVLAWVTHIITSIKTASWVLLVMGSLIFPIGIIHGVAVWLGVL